MLINGNIYRKRVLKNISLEENTREISIGKTFSYVFHNSAQIVLLFDGESDCGLSCS